MNCHILAAAPYFLPLDTKYYTCLVQFETRDFACNNDDSSLPVNAIIINGPLEEAKVEKILKK